MRQLTVWTASVLLLLGASMANAQVVISQVYGGGGNSGATLRSDFVELFNAGSATVDLTGWSVQYASSSGTSWQSTSLSGSIEPGQYFLVKQADGSAGSVSLPTPDVVGSISMSASSGKVALVDNSTRLTGSCPTVVDFVGFGSANCFEGSDGTAALSNTTAAHRLSNGCTDTGDNAADFEIAAPNPRNTASPRSTCASGGETNPTAVGAADPASLLPGELTTLTVTVTPGANPASSGIQVSADLSEIGGSSSQPFVSSDGLVFSHVVVIASGTPAGEKTLVASVTDAQGRATSASISLRVESENVDADHVVISQIYGGGGNSGATWNRDYVELYNPTSAVVDLTGWTLQYASSSGSVTGLNNTVQPLGGLIGPGEYFLAALASGGSTGADLPEANILGAMNMAAGSGKIALVRNGDLISGTCPLGDSDIIDYVGYGSASCSEGGETAPSANNTTALYRLGGGSVDSNVNALDFERGSPVPRRTAPIMEVGPSIVSTDPATNGFNAPRDASITVHFTEPVIVDGNWFSIQCEATGAHDEFTTAGGGKSYVITPNENFMAGERCEVTVYAARVFDEDTDDAEAGTDHLAVDHVWSFTVATGAAPPFSSDVHLMMGNPSGAIADLNQPNNYLMEKPEFALSYSRDRGIPNWVSWHLSSEWVGSLSRFDTFRPDPQVPPEWYRVQSFDFSGSGFDRGHLVPNADRDHEASRPINQATFLMTNMMPQAPDNNQGPWANFENYLRTLLADSEIYVVAGGSGTGGTGSNGYATLIANGNVAVPAWTWKAVLILPKYDGNDVERVDAGTRTLAVIMPNAQGIRTSDPNDWRAYVSTIDAVESLSGYDLFSNVPQAVQNSIEAGTDGVNPPGAADQSIGVREDSYAVFALDAVSTGTLTTQLLTSPSSGTLEVDGIDVTYTPAPDFYGEDGFTYVVSDGMASSNTATVALVVLEVNDSPVAGADAASTDDDTPVAIAAADLLGNDVAGPANERAQSLALSSVASTTQTNGSVSFDGTNVEYTPAPGFAGSASFEYTVCDDGDTAGADDPQCATGVVSVTVFDTTAPVISGLRLSRTRLWPVNHKLVDVQLDWSVSDSGDPSPVCSVTALSSESGNGTGDGNTEIDAEVVNEHLVRLRAERAGNGEGRIYTITVSCSDSSGNTAAQSADVVVAP